MTVRAILFDFDGVIVESVDVKTRAFATLFAAEHLALPAILDFHLANGGMSRYLKFDVIYRDILHRPLDPQERDQLGRRFTELVVAGVLTCPFVPGALEFLQAHAAQLPLLLASGTPEDELRNILARRGLTGYFREAYGSPRGKSEIAHDILRRGGWAPADIPFVGDAANDYYAAAEVGLPFIGRVAPGAANPFPAYVPTVPDLTNLAQFWPELSARTF